MARRSDHTRDELCGLALTAAQDIVEAEGLRALTARRVADAIGYSPGTLYNVFRNLDELTLHLRGRTLDLLYERLTECPPTGDPDLDLDRMLEGYFDFLARHESLWRTVFDNPMTDVAEVPDWYLAKVGRVMGLLEAALAPCFPPSQASEARDAARILWAGLHGICSLNETGKLGVVTDRSAREMASVLVATFVAGIRSAGRLAG